MINPSSCKIHDIPVHSIVSETSLETLPIGHKYMVSQDRWSLVSCLISQTSGTLSQEECGPHGSGLKRGFTVTGFSLVKIVATQSDHLLTQNPMYM